MATTAMSSTKISGGSFLLEDRRPDEVFTPEDFTEQHQLIGQTAEEFAVMRSCLTRRRSNTKTFPSLAIYSRKLENSA